MSLDLYIDYLEVVKSHYSVNGLIKVWYDSAFLPGNVKRTLRKRIEDYIENFGKYYGINVVNTTFQNFVEKYDELMYTKQCNKSPNKCLRYFPKLGDWRNIRIAIRKGANNWNYGMCGAAEGGHPKFVKFFIEKGANNWDDGMGCAARGGHLEMVKFFVEKGADNWNWGMWGAAEGGYFELVKFFIEKGANNWNLGIRGAAKNGCIELVEFFINKGADDWDWGMYYAAQGGHLELVKFFIDRACTPNSNQRLHIETGADDWNLGIQGAIRGGHFNLVEFFIEKGAVINYRIERKLEKRQIQINQGETLTVKVLDKETYLYTRDMNV